jgi:hypothetical protein
VSERKQPFYYYGYAAAVVFYGKKWKIAAEFILKGRKINKNKTHSNDI